MTRHGIFLSSVQKEFAAERLALRDFLQGDPLLRRFYRANAVRRPARQRPPRR